MLQFLSFEANAYRACILDDSIPRMDVSVDGPEAAINDYLIYSRTYSGPIERYSIEKSLNEFLCREESAMTFGPGDEPITIVIRIQNKDDHRAIWTLSTSRFTVRAFQLYDITASTPIVLLDTSDREAALVNVREHMGFGEHFVLEAGEEKIFGIRMKVETGTGFPVEILPVGEFSQLHFENSTIVSALASAIFTIALLNLLLFSATRRTSFAWLALAEMLYGFFFLQSLGFVSRFGLAYYPDINIVIADIPKALFCASMSQFARSFLDTRKKGGFVDIFLKGLITVGLSVSLLWLVSPLLGEFFRSLLRTISWALVGVTALYLPIVGASAYREKGAYYLPLFIGWCVYALVMVYFIIGFTNIIPNLPTRVTWVGIAGLVEGIFVSIALGLQIYSASEEAQQTSIDYQNSLEERIALIQERELAAATIKDQIALLKASGHDTQQVLMSINSAAHHLEMTDNRKDAQLLDTLKASAAFLEDILSTTLSAPAAYDVNRECVALSLFSVADFLLFMDKIYRPLFHRDALDFEVYADEDLQLISDKALLARIISNFMVNSLKFTDEGGVYCKAYAEGQSVVIELKDTGRGIAPHVLEQMTADSAHKVTSSAMTDSSGSGFKIAQNLLKRIKGQLYIDSKVGEGTLLKISLPVALKDGGVTATLEMGVHSDFVLHDIDRHGISIDELDLPIVGVTFDSSPQMRSKASETCSCILHKPLVKEMFEHPVLKPDKEN